MGPQTNNPEDRAPNTLLSRTTRDIFSPSPKLQNFRNGVSLFGRPLQSPNFASGSSGWRIDSNGNAEFNDGTFRGTFNIGGTVITIDNTENIQENLNTISASGGGTLFLQAGTYTLTADLQIPAGVNLEGISREACTIECGSYSVVMSGSNPYSAGTVTINNGDTTVVGSGTTWTSGMVGQSIWLDGTYYEITAFTDTTHLTIATYAGVNLAGATYVIATFLDNPKLTKLTIQNSTGSAIEANYSNNPQLFDLNVYGSAIGIDMSYTLFPEILSYTIENDVNLSVNYATGLFINYSSFDFSTTGVGISLSNVVTSSMYNSSCSFNTTSGMSLTNCTDNTIFDTNFLSNGANGVSVTGCSMLTLNTVSLSSNGAHGIEFVSGSTDSQISQAQIDGNTSAGIKLTATSDRNVFTASSVTNNGTYGVQIANANCDNNILIGIIATGNGTASTLDSGTGTLKSTTVNVLP